MTENPLSSALCPVTGLLEHELAVEAVHDYEDGVRQIVIGLPSLTPFPYHAGQYVWLVFGAFAPRAYSIANAPDGHGLEIHIRDTETGGASSYAVRSLKPAETVGVSGARGACYYEATAPEPPALLCIAGGLGITQAKAIVEAALCEPRRTRPVTLIWGVRHEKDLYLSDYFEDLAEACRVFTYKPLISSHFQPDFLPETLDKTDYHVYLSGPTGMIEGLLPVLSQKHIPADRIHYDRHEDIVP